MFPKIEKKLSSFFVCEGGKISKHSLLSLGSFVSAAIIGGVLMSKDAAAQHTNDLSLAYSESIAAGVHSHHTSHSSHSSHSSSGGGSCGGGSCAGAGAGAGAAAGCGTAEGACGSCGGGGSCGM